MKFLAVLFSMALAFNASADLISAETDQASYNTGDIVTVDIFVNDLNPALDSFGVDFGFDDSLLGFEEFSWLDTVDVLNFGAFGDAYAGLTDDTLIIQGLFLAGITDVLGTSFKLGTLEFKALTDITAPLLFNSLLFEAVDVDFNAVEAQEVSEPATYALFPLIMGFMFLSSKRKRG